MSLACRLFTLCALAFASQSPSGVAAAESARASDPAPAPELFRLSILNVRPLIFSRAFQGDPPETAAPSEADERAALFVITGRPFLTVSLLLPEDEVDLHTLSFEPGPKRLRVRNLVTQPQAGESFHLGLFGMRKVHVGGTREAVHRRQASGPYLGRFFLTVVHQ